MLNFSKMETSAKGSSFDACTIPLNDDPVLSIANWVNFTIRNIETTLWNIPVANTIAKSKRGCLSNPATSFNKPESRFLSEWSEQLTDSFESFRQAYRDFSDYRYQVIEQLGKHIRRASISQLNERQILAYRMIFKEILSTINSSYSSLYSTWSRVYTDSWGGCLVRGDDGKISWWDYEQMNENEIVKRIAASFSQTHRFVEGVMKDLARCRDTITKTLNDYQLDTDNKTAIPETIAGGPPSSPSNKPALSLRQVGYLYMYLDKEINELTKNEIAKQFGHKANNAGQRLFKNHYLLLAESGQRTAEDDRDAEKNIQAAMNYLKKHHPEATSAIDQATKELETVQGRKK